MAVSERAERRTGEGEEAVVDELPLWRGIEGNQGRPSRRTMMEADRRVRAERRIRKRRQRQGRQGSRVSSKDDGAGRARLGTTKLRTEYFVLV